MAKFNDEGMHVIICVILCEPDSHASKISPVHNSVPFEAGEIK